MWRVGQGEAATVEFGDRHIEFDTERQREFHAMSWLGLDIGGANLKAADTAGWAKSVPFALWRDPQGLVEALAVLVDMRRRPIDWP